MRTKPGSSGGAAAQSEGQSGGKGTCNDAWEGECKVGKPGVQGVQPDNQLQVQSTQEQTGAESDRQHQPDEIYR
jgi:hypothetical protein